MWINILHIINHTLNKERKKPAEKKFALVYELLSDSTDTVTFIGFNDYDLEHSSTIFENGYKC